MEGLHRDEAIIIKRDHAAETKKRKKYSSPAPRTRNQATIIPTTNDGFLQQG